MQLSLLFTALLLSLSTVFAQNQAILFNDSTLNSQGLVDITQTFLWGSNTDFTSAFEVMPKQDNSGTSFNAITLSDSGAKYAGYIPPNSLKAGSAFDIRIPPINRQTDTLEVSYDVLWGIVNSGGQSSRIMVAAVYNYPDNFPVSNAINDPSLPEAFGRPAYSYRILNRTPQGTNNYANMQFGGGRSIDGEFEQFSISGQPAWWLPGFISAPGGTSPESGAPLNYPHRPVFRYLQRTLASSTQWRHFRWMIYPERLEVYTRASNAQGPDTLVMFMAVPKPDPDIATMVAKINAVHGSQTDTLPLLYKWFPTIEGLRFYHNGPQVFLSNINIKAQGLLTHTKSGIEAVKIAVYPNPADKAIQLTAHLNGARFEIWSADGRKVMQGRVNDYAPLEVSNLKQGVYWMRFPDNREFKPLRWIKK
jgi:hypothetical protein